MISFHFSILEDVRAKKGVSSHGAPTTQIRLVEDDYGTYLSVEDLACNEFSEACSAYITPERARTLAAALTMWADMADRQATDPPPTLRTGEPLPTEENNE